MLNEHQTGQGTDGQVPAGMAPPDVDETRTCAQCSRSFVAKPSSNAVLCSLCFVTKMEDEQRANQPFEKQLWKRKQRAQLLGALGVAVLAILAVLAMMIRSDRRAERSKQYDQWRKEQGYKSTGY